MIPIETDNILAKELNKITGRKFEDDIWRADFADMELVCLKNQTKLLMSFLHLFWHSYNTVCNTISWRKSNGSTCHSTIKMEPKYEQSELHIEYILGYSKLKPKFKVVDHIRIYKWKKKCTNCCQSTGKNR